MSKIKTLFRLLKEDNNGIGIALFENLTRMHVFNWLSDKAYIKLAFRIKLHKKIDLNNPITFNEKLQWIKLNDRKAIYSSLVDKYLVKEYVANIIGKEHIVKTLGIWDSVDEINYCDLPSKFVLKCTHDSGSTIVCKDKANFNREMAEKKLRKRMRMNLFYWGREWPYKDVKPRIIAEEYIEPDDGDELKDYKFFCFNGVMRCFKIDFDRFSNHGANYYDASARLLPFGEKICPPNFEKQIEIPKCINEMLEYAEKLAMVADFARVDFYTTKGKVYFGEITFFPAAGFGKFIPDEWDEKLGHWLTLTSKK